MLDIVLNRLIWKHLEKRKNRGCNCLCMCTDYIWGILKKQEENRVGEAGLGSRLSNVYPSFCTLWVVTNSKDLKMKPAERRVTPFKGLSVASISPPSPTDTRGSSGRCTRWRLGTNFSPAASILLVQVSVLIASSTVIFPVLPGMLLWAVCLLWKTSTLCRFCLLWEYSSPMGGGWSSSQSTESSSVSTTMWHSRSPFLAQPTMMGKMSSSR